MQNTLTETGLALLIGAIGAVLAVAIGFPAPYLTGPALAVTVVGLAGLRLSLPQAVRDVSFTLIGIAMGTGVSPQVLEEAGRWPVTLVLLAVSLTVILWTSRRVLQRRFSYDRISAVLASSPGHLSYILGLSAEISTDVARVSIVQSLRLLALTLLVPSIVAALDDGPRAVLAQPAMMAPLTFAVVFGLSVLVGWCGKKLGAPAAYIIGGMLVSTIGHASGLTPGVAPRWLTISCFLVMGTLIGTRFSGVTPAMVRSAFGAGGAVMAIAAGVSVVAASGAALLSGLPFGQVLIAFAPGGVEAMVAMAILLDTDPGFVAAHHVMRLFLLAILVPLALRRPRSREKP